jgi:hypothetical protein
MPECPLIAIRPFIQATRDSGYKSTSSAIAELVDNAFEAKADSVTISLCEQDDGKQITVTDNGTGMSPRTLQMALQFGGSTRFDSRRGTGRYGMGLPNGSLSQARRVVVRSWTNPRCSWSTHLDVDEVVSGRLTAVPPPVRLKSSETGSPSGTTVILTRCDRLDCRTLKAQTKRLHADLGRIFRQQLYDGKTILVNQEAVRPIDPLFLRKGDNLVGADPFGPPLTYNIAVSEKRTSPIVVRFTVLPLETWHSLSNEEKNQRGISKGSGVSVVRAAREIDYGWYFMGTKRRENYDDWWRCEVSFFPELDEMFGVTHTKQKINPTEVLSSILEPDLERIARELNSLVRKRYTGIRGGAKELKSVAIATERESLIKPVAVRSNRTNGTLLRRLSRLGYQIDEQSLREASFYLPSIVRDSLTLILNRDHSFYQKIYRPLAETERLDSTLVLEKVQLVLLAAARAECALESELEKSVARKLREAWSNALMAFLG